MTQPPVLPLNVQQDSKLCMNMQADATGTIVKFLTPNGAPVTVGQVSFTWPHIQADVVVLGGNLLNSQPETSDLHPVDILAWLQALALIKP